MNIAITPLCQYILCKNTSCLHDNILIDNHYLCRRKTNKQNMSTVTKSIDFSLPYKVADITLAEWGRKEIRLAEAEMNMALLNR
jgi:hypothetical protein